MGTIVFIVDKNLINKSGTKTICQIIALKFANIHVCYITYKYKVI